ncbi:hypothetical protein BDZ97DRAFT_1903028 [Flammula alnicola]|nr:hypothetical protein BDZ97DRAFT_1903028 [Flammula alnicola]
MAAAARDGRPNDPNFPLNLDIHPSLPISHSSLLGDATDLDANFDSLAQELAIRQYGIAGRVWEAAYAMTLYVQPHGEFDPPFIDASRSSERLMMIELGSGSGLVAATIAKLLTPGRHHLIATDLPEVGQTSSIARGKMADILQEVCPLLEANLHTITTRAETDSSHNGVVTVVPVSWGKREDALALASAFFDDQSTRPNFGPLTHIICSDLVYFPELLGPLLRSLLHLSSPPFISLPCDGPIRRDPTIYISYKIRSLAKETPFWSAFGLWFDFSPVLMKEKSGKGEWKRFGTDFDDTTFLFVAHRRPQSYKWKIPPLDDDLLGGVGSYGTDTRKGDDTFENLLLMLVEQD